MDFAGVASLMQAYSLPGSLANTIKAFVVSEKWTLENASAQGQVRLLDYLLDQEWSGVPLSFRRARLNNAIKLAIHDGHVQVLRWWLNTYLPEEDPSVFPTIFRLACQLDQVIVLQWLQATDRLSRLQPNLKGRIVKCFSQELASWLHLNAHGTGLALEVANYVQKEGCAAFIRWAVKNRHLYETSVHCSRYILDEVVPNGHVHVVEWLCSFYSSTDLANPTNGCADLKMAKWMLHEYKWKTKQARARWIDASISAAAACHAMKLVEYLFSIDPNANAHNAICVAAECGDLEMIKSFPKQNSRRSGALPIDKAIANGHLDVAIWLQENQYGGISMSAMAKAAANGFLDILKWLHSNRLDSFTHDTIEMAAANGHLDVVEWLWNVVPNARSSTALKSAAIGGRLEIVRFLHGSGYEFSTDDVIWNAASHGRLDMVKWLYENIPKPSDHALQFAIGSAGRNGHMGAAQFLAAKVSILKPWSQANIHTRRLLRSILYSLRLWTCSMRPASTWSRRDYSCRSSANISEEKWKTALRSHRTKSMIAIEVPWMTADESSTNGEGKHIKEV